MRGEGSYFKKRPQNQLIANHVQKVSEKTERCRLNKKESRRNYSRDYYLENSGRIEVFQKMFLSTLDLTLKKDRIIVEKKRNSSLSK